MPIHVRPASGEDLQAINAVIEAAVMGWDLPERVKRLSLPSYRYDSVDLAHLAAAVAEAEGRVVGVATWEPADPRDVPAGRAALLLHGLYVDPAWQRQGIGRQLLAAVREAAARDGQAGVLVKAQADARGFFEGNAFVALDPEDPDRHYAHRYWLEPG